MTTCDSTLLLTHSCKTNSTLCVLDEEVCDGIPQCPDGSDEDLDTCKDFFPPSATVKCSKVGIENRMSVPILAIPCNSIIECVDGIDEEHCGYENWIAGITLGVGLLFITIVSTIVVSLTELYNTETVDLDKAIQELDEIQIRNLVVQSQPIDHEVYNKKYFQMTLDKFEGNYSQALNYCKDMLGPSVTKILLADISRQSPPSKIKIFLQKAILK